MSKRRKIINMLDELEKRGIKNKYSNPVFYKKLLKPKGWICIDEYSFDSLLLELQEQNYIIKENGNAFPPILLIGRYEEYKDFVIFEESKNKLLGMEHSETFKIPYDELNLIAYKVQAFTNKKNE